MVLEKAVPVTHQIIDLNAMPLQSVFAILTFEKRLSSSERIIYFALKMRSLHFDEGIPVARCLTIDTGYGVTAVNEALSVLKKTGFIDRTFFPNGSTQTKILPLDAIYPRHMLFGAVEGHSESRSAHLIDFESTKDDMKGSGGKIGRGSFLEYRIAHILRTKSFYQGGAE